MLRLHAISRRDGGDLDGMHLLWSAPWPTGHALKGFTIQRRLSSEQERFHCFDIFPTDLQAAIQQGFTDVSDARIWSTPTNQLSPGSGPWVFRLELQRQHHTLSITGSGGICAFAGRSDGQVVDGRSFVGSTCTLTGANIAVVWLIAKVRRKPFHVCGDVEEHGGWEQARILIEGLQVPFRIVNGELGTQNDEQLLAEHRADPEPLIGDFGEVSQYGNTAYARPFSASPWRVVVRDPNAEHSRWDTAPMGFLSAAGAVSPAWQRALGFAHLDRDDLVGGETYDYRISGLVPRADRDERRLDFHSVPRGFVLPSLFRMEDVGVHVISPTPPVIDVQEGGGTPVPILKGIRFHSLRLILPALTERLGLDGDSNGPIDLIAFAGGAPVINLSETLSGRTIVDFGTSVEEVVVKGEGFLTAIIPEPLSAGIDPDEPVEISETIYRVTFAPTSPPPAPSAIEVENLGSASRAARREQRDDTVGFEISWMPPLRMDPGLLPWWPEDARTGPPTEVAGYVLEREWDDQPFVPVQGTDGRYASSRNAEPVTDTPSPGFNLLAVYPPAYKTGIASDPLVRAVEGFDGDDPAFGTMVTYGVSSVDAIGRRSPRTLATPVQLQKLTRPPAPVAPLDSITGAGPIGPDTLVSPSGVQARLLQANDADLTDSERDMVDNEGDVVLLRWGWGAVQRGLDPHVAEFRIYESVGRLIEIDVDITGPPSARFGGGWMIPCSFSRAVVADEFTGRVIVLGLAYTIGAHGAGTSAALELEAAVANPAASPVGSSFSLIRTDGLEQNPARWDTRVQVVPRSPIPADPQALEQYEIHLPATWITVTPEQPRQHRSFGITAADSESYVPDRRVAVEVSPRPGNESLVASAEVVARYRGRPSLSIANLGSVPRITLRRATANGVHLEFRPSDYLPTGGVPMARMRIERGPASAVLRRLIVDAGPIRLRSRDGTETLWVLSAADTADLRTEYAQRAVSDRFLAHAATQLADLDKDFEKVADVDPTRTYRDLLPNSPARWLYRVRAVDVAGSISPEAQVLEVVVRVPKPSRGASPELVDLTLTDGTAQVTVRARGEDETQQVFLIHSNDTRLRVAQADLATVRNRPDLPPQEQVVIRDDRGTVLPMTPVSPGVDRTAVVDFAVPDGRRFHVWALSVSADGVPSRLIGPLHTVRGYPPELA